MEKAALLGQDLPREGRPGICGLVINCLLVNVAMLAQEVTVVWAVQRLAKPPAV